MSEPNKKADTTPFLKRLFRNSSYSRLPWKQVLRPGTLFWILAPIALMALLSVPQMTVEAYHRVPLASPVLSALAVFSVGLIMWAMLASILVLCVAIIWQLVLDTIHAVCVIRTGIKAIPGLLSRFRAACGRGYRRVKEIPPAIKRMDSEQSSFAGFMTIALAFLGGITYLGWTPASRLASHLPSWMIPAHDFMGILVLDLFGSMLLWSFLMPVLASVVFRIFPGLRPKRSDKDGPK